MMMMRGVVVWVLVVGEVMSLQTGGKKVVQGKGAATTTRERMMSDTKFSMWQEEGVGIREVLVKTLTKLDQGEFRWELLTPWVRDRRLETWEKGVVSLVFVALAVSIQTMLVPRQSLQQHLSYVASFLSYAISSPVGYRSIAIANSAADVYARDSTGFELTDDAIPDGYNAIFVVLNGYYLLRWALNRADGVKKVLTPVQCELYDRCFEPLGVGAYQYLKLLERAKFKQPRSKTPLTVQGEPLTKLYVTISGDFDVSTGGSIVASIPEYQIIGEAAALENLQSTDGTFHQAARATVIAEPNSKYAEWSHADLYQLNTIDNNFKESMRLAFSRTLSHKLSAARVGATRRQQVTLPPILAPDIERVFTAKLQQQGFTADIAAAFFRVAARESATARRQLSVDARKHMLALSTGAAEAFDADGCKVLRIAAPDLLGVDRFLETIIIFNGVPPPTSCDLALRGGGDDASAAAAAETTPTRPCCLSTIVLEPGSTAYVWDLATVNQALKDQPSLRGALNRLYLASWTSAPAKARALVGSSQSPDDDDPPSRTTPEDAALLL